MTGELQTVTFSAHDVRLGEFKLPAGHPRWNRVATIGPEWPLIAFAGPAVEIQQLGRQPVVADAMRAVTYPPGQPYRRRLISPAGDRCAFVSFSPRIAAEAALPFDPSADNPLRYRFPFPAVGVGQAEFILKQRLRRRAKDEAADPGEIREQLYHLIERAVESGYRELGRTPGRQRSSTRNDHAQLADAVRRIIGSDLSARLSLDDIAAAVYTSPFHLSRVFQAQTATSIHAYRTQLRLRASLERIADGEHFARIAVDLGFSSQAHLAHLFRRAYGMTPAAWRSGLRRSQTSRILKEGRPPAA